MATSIFVHTSLNIYFTVLACLTNAGQNYFDFDSLVKEQWGDKRRLEGKTCEYIPTNEHRHVYSSLRKSRL